MAQQERARRTRAAIVEAAASEFSRRGYAAASVNTILEGSRATKGAMYFHFSSKEELAKAVLQTAVDKYSTIMDRPRSGDLDPLESLHEVIDELARTFRENIVVQAEFRLIIEPEFYSEISGGAGSVWGRKALTLVRAAHERGLLKPEADPEKFTRVLMASLAGQRYLADLMRDDTDLSVLFDESYEVVLQAMATPEWLEQWRARGWPEREPLPVD